MNIIIGCIGIGVMLLLLALGVSVTFAMGLTGFIGFAVLWGTGTAASLTVISAYTNTSGFMLACIPLFIFMGHSVFYCGLASNLFSALQKWLSRLPGGLAMAVTAGSAGFASVCGSSPATAATMGAVALPEMRRLNYSPRLATGCLAAAGTLGILIPPSLPMVFYGILTEQSIGRLFIAGIVPGIFSAFLYMAMIYVRAKRDPTLAPPGPSSTWKEKLNSLQNVWPVVLLFSIVMGGIYFGYFTPTEAAGVGAFVALLIGLAYRCMTKKALFDSLGETVQLSGMILATIVGAMIFTSFIVTTGVSTATADFVASLEVNRYVILFLMLVIYIILGCIMSPITIMVLTIPLFFPIVLKLGFDPIWFGVILTKMIEVAMITPPIGINCLIIKNIAKEYVTTMEIFRGIGWFFVMDLTTIAILVAFPQISLFLPNMMFQ